MAAVKKGIILSVIEDKAAICPVDDQTMVDMSVSIPSYLSEENIGVHDTVAYTVFGDMTGIVLAKM